jgi:hypothetical protein
MSDATFAEDEDVECVDAFKDTYLNAENVAGLMRAANSCLLHKEYAYSFIEIQMQLF